MRIWLALALVWGCKDKPAPPSAPSGSGSGSAVVVARPIDAAPASSGSGALPKECDEWRAAVDRLMACEKMPAAQKTALHEAFAVAEKDWAALAKQDRDTLAVGCKSGADAIVASAKATCGW